MKLAVEKDWSICTEKLALDIGDLVCIRLHRPTSKILIEPPYKTWWSND